MIHVYHTSCTTKLSDPVFFNYLNLLPRSIRNKILKFHRWQDAQTALFGKLLLKRGLADMGLGSDLTNLKYTDRGRPYMEDAPDFNISHSGPYAVCAFSKDGRVGVDIEEVKPIPVNDFKDQFQEKEWNIIINSENLYHSFYDYWTAKESIIKAEGSGLYIPLREVLIEKGRSFLHHKIWFYEKMPLSENFILQVASDKTVSNIRLIKVTL